MGIRILVLLGVFICVVGCDEKQQSDSESDRKTGVIPQAQIDALNKAKGVEQLLKDTDEKKRQELKKQGY